MRDQWKPAAILLAAFTLLTGLIYPLAITAIAQTVFPYRANGSILMVDGRAVGSELIGQPFSAPEYFWSRPSATTPFPYNAAASAGSNYGPLNEDLLERAHTRVRALREADPSTVGPIPVDLLTGSGSGLDPHISLAGAFYQAARVARARGLDASVVREWIHRQTEGRLLGLVGEPRVNVLRLNLALDSLSRRLPGGASVDRGELPVRPSATEIGSSTPAVDVSSAAGGPFATDIAPTMPRSR